MIGERLFPAISKHQPDLAGKITGTRRLRPHLWLLPYCAYEALYVLHITCDPIYVYIILGPRRILLSGSKHNMQSAFPLRFEERTPDM